MAQDIDSARDDLAFIRALVTDHGRIQASTGTALMAGGLCYGFQCLLHGLQMLDLVPDKGLVALAAAIGPTIVFLAILGVLIARDRRQGPIGSTASRALNAAFGGAGLATMTTAIVFGYNAARWHSLAVWMFHPIMVCVLQGAVWYVVFAMQRRAWPGLVSLGWFGTAIALGLALGNDAVFLLVMGGALLLLMALPGWVLRNSAKRSA